MKIYSENKIEIVAPVQSTDFLIGRNLLSNLHQISQFRNNKYSSFLFLSDFIVYKLYGDQVISSLSKLGKPVITSIISPGEKFKDLIMIPDTVKPYFRQGFDRQAC